MPQSCRNDSLPKHKAHLQPDPQTAICSIKSRQTGVSSAVASNLLEGTCVDKTKESIMNDQNREQEQRNQAKPNQAKPNQEKQVGKPNQEKRPGEKRQADKPQEDKGQARR
jgi:hypothetical protein